MNCDHKNESSVEQIFKNKIKHVKISCADCGKFLRYDKTAKDEFELALWIMPIGKHKGLTLNDIAKVDNEYLIWASKTLDGNIKRRIDKFLS